MRTIGIFSDTHGYFNKSLLSFFEPCDELWHAGDWGNLACYDEVAAFKPLKTVYGNIDGQELRACMPKIKLFTVEGLKVCIIHIGGYPGRYSPDFKKILEMYKIDIMVCGHSHILKVMRDKKNNLMHFNPGAAGNHGFHKKITALRLNINQGKMENLEVWETDRQIL